MAEFPALNLYTDAFMADTPHMDARATGAYFCLLMASWRTEDGGLPDNDKLLARMSRCSTRDWKAVRDLVMPFWTMCQDGKWRQKRLEIERDLARGRSTSASRAAKAMWLERNKRREAAALKAHKRNGSADDATTTTTTTIEEESKKESLPPSLASEAEFETLWKAYPIKKGKGPARKAYGAAVKKASHDALITAVQEFALAVVNQDPKFIPHPATWLNGERWLDEKDQSNGHAKPSNAQPEHRDGWAALATAELRKRGNVDQF